MEELKSNCWCSFEVITTSSAVFYAVSPSDHMHSELLEVPALEPGQADCNVPLLKKTLAEDTSCLSRNEMQSQLLWRPGVEFLQTRACPQEGISQNHNSSWTASYSSSNLHWDVFNWKETAEGLGETAAEETRQLISTSSAILTHCTNLNSNLSLCLNSIVFRTGLITSL